MLCYDNAIAMASGAAWRDVGEKAANKNRACGSKQNLIVAQVNNDGDHLSSIRLMACEHLRMKFRTESIGMKRGGANQGKKKSTCRRKEMRRRDAIRLTLRDVGDACPGMYRATMRLLPSISHLVNS